MQMPTLQSNSENLSEPSLNGSTSNQDRHKKALKQINKLVHINSKLENQLQEWKKNYRKLQEDYHNLEQKYNQQTNKNSQNQDQLPSENQQTKQGNLEYRNSTFSEAESYHVFSNKVSQYEMQAPNILQIQEQFSEQISYLKQQISQYDIKISQKDDIISQLQITLEKKHSEVIALEERCGDLNQRILKMRNQIESEFNTKIDLEKQSSGKKIYELQQKLKKAEDWSKKIQSDYEMIRKSIVLSQPAIPDIVSSLKFSEVKKIRTDQDLTLRNQYKSKSKYKQGGINKLQEIGKIKNEYNEKKNKYKGQILRLKQEIEDMTKRMYSMSTFIEKQQLYIEAYVDKNEQIREKINQ